MITLSLMILKKKINSKSKFRGYVDNQILTYSKKNKFFGSSEQVFKFLKKIDQ